MVLANNIEGRGRQLLLPYAIYGAFAFLAMVLEKNDSCGSICDGALLL